MRILITGGKGMLGRTLHAHWQQSHTCFVADLPETDLTQPETVASCFDRFKPHVVVHCAAMTNVDLCESEPEQAFLLNEILTTHIAQACHRHNARLIAISTDYVFAGDITRPLTETDIPAPKTIYGSSKLAAETAVRTYCPNHLIARVAWLYGSGGPSFVHTVVNLAHEAPTRPLTIVNDQYGNPTSADAVATALTAILNRPDIIGTLHLTCEGVTTWYNLAKTIFQQLGYTTLHLMPCTSETFRRPAPRPPWSALSKDKLATLNLPPMPSWQDALTQFIRSEWANHS